MSTALLVVPDYASHYYPMAAVGESLSIRGHRVVVATGVGLAGRVVADGFEHVALTLGPGSNPGLIDPGAQTRSERLQLEELFAATRRGMVPALLHQARHRRRDLLHEPARVAADIDRILGDVAPHVVVVDQLAFGATAALRGLQQPFVSFHPGHPSAISVGWPYGYPPRFPDRIHVDDSDLKQLEELCRRVVEGFTDEYNRAVAELNPDHEAVADAFAAVSPSRALINYPAVLGEAYGLPAPSRYIGSAVRSQPLPAHLPAKTGSRPRVYASLGSFFSARSDILEKLVSGFRHQPVELVLAVGVTPRARLGPIPDHWTVAGFLPQPALIRTADLVITHGGNNTVTEALTAGVPLLVGPLSTDQFAAAADVDTAGLGAVFDPNLDDGDTIAEMARETIGGGAAATAADLGRALRARPGQDIAADFIEAEMTVAAAI